MKRLLLASLLLACSTAYAQAIPVTTNMSTTAPTTTTEGAPLVGALAVVEYQWYVSNAPIPGDTVEIPTTLQPSVTSTGLTASATINVVPGGTVYVRARACIKGTATPLSCSVMTGMATRAVPKVTIPNPPSNLQVTVTVTVQ